MGQPDILAIFTPQAPVEQASSPQKHDSGDDDGFHRIMDDANHKVSPPNENNKPETDRQDHSSNKQSDKKPVEKSKATENKQTDQTSSKEIDQNSSQELSDKTQSTSAESENISYQELASVENFQEAMDHLKELGFDVKSMEVLLEIFNDNSGLDVGSLLQSLTSQNLKIKDFSLNDFIAANNLDENSFSYLDNRKSLISDLLKQSGFTDREVKNLINKFESKSNNKSDLNTNLTKQDLSSIDKELKPDVANKVSKDLDNTQPKEKINKDDGQSDKNLNSKNEVKNKNEDKGLEKADNKNNLNTEGRQRRANTSSKGDEKQSSSNENIKIESKNTGQGKTISQDTIGMKYSDTNLNAGKSKNLEAIKANGDVQIQNNNMTGGNNKTALNAKAGLPENTIYKAPIESRVIDQIINRLSVRSNGSQSEVKIQLDPPSLGRVRMNIVTSGDGVRTVIVAENQAVKQVIENNLSQLRDSMLSQGLKLDGFSVLVGGDSNPEFSQQHDNSGQSGLEDYDSIDTEELEIESDRDFERQTSFIFDDTSQKVRVVA